jgi:Flp pilus assembly protein TadD
MSARLIIRAALLFAAVATAAVAQQLPPGTRDATDTSRTDAASAQLRAAETALEKGDFAAAVKTLTTLAAARPADAQILYDLGFAQERTDDDAGAAKSYEAAIAADANAAEPRLALALLDARSGRTGKAHGEFAAVTQLATAPPQLKARAFRALAQLDETSNPAAASDDLLAAIKLTGETPADTALTAALADRAGDKAGAEAAYRRILQASPDDTEAAVGLAHILLQSDHAAEAETTLAGPLKAHPADPRLVSQMAAIYAAENKTEQAIPLLVQLRSDPKFAADPALTRQLARLYALDNQNAQAEELFKAALAKTPADPSLLDDLGTTLVRQQKYPEAQKILEAAVALRDKFPTPADFGDAAGHLAFAASKNGQPREVLQALRIRATVLPNSAPSLFLEATAHDTLHEYKEAEQAYRAFLAIAAGQFPDQEFQAKHRLIALEHMK